MTFLARAGEERRVAYAVGRPVGGAVERNRVRRRLRALMADAVGGPEEPGPGDYLVSVSEGAASVDFDGLGGDLRRALAAVGSTGPSGAQS